MVYSAKCIMMNTNIDIETINSLAKEAGKAIMEVYESDEFEVVQQDMVSNAFVLILGAVFIDKLNIPI